MKRIAKILAVPILILVLLFYPKRVVYEAKISGKVIDENGVPIKDAIVSRVEERRKKERKQLYLEFEKFKSQIVSTDINGYFELSEKSRIDWIPRIALPFCWCYADFEVSKKGYEIYKTEFSDYSEYNENLNGCKDIEFNPKIVLKKQ